MSSLFGFPGGVHPPENKAQSNPGLLIELPIPPTLVVPLAQHIGKPAKPCVQVGDAVYKGQPIARADDTISAHVHAPTSGTVTAIALHVVPHPSGLDALCITIQTDGLDTWHASSIHDQVNHQPSHQRHIATSKPFDPSVFTAEHIQQCIKDAGIIGMGGAGFPTSVKTNPPKAIHTLLINGVECEPYIAADDTLMQVYTNAFIAGTQLVQQCLSVERCIIVVEDNKPDAIAKITHTLQKNSTAKTIELVVIPTKYPSGGERQLIENVLGQQVPAQGLPADLGIVCINVATAKAVYDAVVLDRPSIDRIITVTGDTCLSPGNYQVLIGTPIDYILSHAMQVQGNDIDTNIGTSQQQHQLARIIMGGPMMGFELPHGDIPITKTSNCVLLPKKHQLAHEQSMECIRCGQCEVVCPANLLPQQLYWYAKSDSYDKLKEYNLFDCIECGACAYVCPSQIPLVQHYRYAKGTISTLDAEASLADYARQRFESREQRLADEQAAKQQKRQERAIAAAAAQAAKRNAGEDDPIAAAKARLATNTEKTTHPVDDNIVSSDHTEQHLKTLKTAAAIARTKLKKAEKALATAQAQTQEMDETAQLSKYQSMVDSLKDKAEQAQQALADAQQARPTQANANKSTAPTQAKTANDKVDNKSHD